ncbi:MAG: lipoyl synthase [Clostridia bacterium]|nr:MAG: lipoyl synthase [Clostridia bacterium]
MPAGFPAWLKKRLPVSPEIDAVREMVAGLGLHTVCSSAHCPNLGECFARRTATFMILGDICTRNCRFCAVKGGQPGPPDPDEPQRVSEAAARLGLRHVVVTSVTRDDLVDGGAGQFAFTIAALRSRLPEAVVEVLTPDFQGSAGAVGTVVAAGPHIFNHNLETVPRLYRQVRPGADYRRSLEVLRLAKETEAAVYTKSGLMVGLGEKVAEVELVMQDLRAAGCDILTIGQYLQPTAGHLPVQEFVHPDVFSHYERLGRDMGFVHVASGPFVRSSYQADAFSPRTT